MNSGGAESDGDERFVRTLCGDYGIPLHVIPAPLHPETTRAVGVELGAPASLRRFP